MTETQTEQQQLMRDAAESLHAAFAVVDKLPFIIEAMADLVQAVGRLEQTIRDHREFVGGNHQKLLDQQQQLERKVVANTQAREDAEWLQQQLNSVLWEWHRAQTSNQEAIRVLAEAMAAAGIALPRIKLLPFSRPPQKRKERAG